MSEENLGQRDARKPVNGFRLIWQILGTLIVVGVLAAIFFPVYTDSHPTSPRTLCLSNLKQLSLGVTLYTTDYDDLSPISYSFDGVNSQTKFMEAVYPYTKNRDHFICPQEKKDIKENGAVPSGEGIPGKMNYVHCLFLRGLIPEFSTGKRVLNMNKVPNQAVVPYLRDCIRGYGQDKNTKVVGFLSPHGAGFVTAYLDGHVKYKSPVDINTDL